MSDIPADNGDMPPRDEGSRGDDYGDRSDSSEGHKLYIGNLAFETTQDDLREKFAKYGDVKDAYIPRDRRTGNSRGFGFVTFLDRRDAEDAEKGMNEQDFQGRTIRVNFARPRPDRRSYDRRDDRRDYRRRDDYDRRDYDRRDSRRDDYDRRDSRRDDYDRRDSRRDDYDRRDRYD